MANPSPSPDYYNFPSFTPSLAPFNITCVQPKVLAGGSFCAGLPTSGPYNQCCVDLGASCAPCDFGYQCQSKSCAFGVCDPCDRKPTNWGRLLERGWRWADNWNNGANGPPPSLLWPGPPFYDFPQSNWRESLPEGWADSPPFLFMPDLYSPL